MNEPTVVTWDGKDLAAVQAATAHLPRVGGEPFATVEQGPGPFRLRLGHGVLGGVDVPVGATIVIVPAVAAVFLSEFEETPFFVVAPDGTISWQHLSFPGDSPESPADPARGEEQERILASAELMLSDLAGKGIIEPGYSYSCHWDEPSDSWKLVANCRMTFGGEDQENK